MFISPVGTFWLDKVNIAATGWSDGSVVESEFWAQHERCIVVKDGVWHIKDCTSEHKFLCQVYHHFRARCYGSMKGIEEMK